MWSELTWFMWSDFILKWNELRWSSGQKHRVHYSDLILRVLAYILTISFACILCCGCFNLYCNVWACVCVGVLVICVLVSTVFCIVCTVVFVLFRLFIFIRICFVCTSVRTTCHLVTPPPICLLLLLLLLFFLTRIHRPGLGVDHPPHLAFRLKKEYSYNLTTPLGLHGLFQGNLYLHLCQIQTLGWRGLRQSREKDGETADIRRGWKRQLTRKIANHAFENYIFTFAVDYFTLNCIKHKDRQFLVVCHFPDLYTDAFPASGTSILPGRLVIKPGLHKTRAPCNRWN